MSNPYLVSTDWLADRLGDPTLIPVDGSWHLPDAKRDGRAEFLERHIPGAAFFDVDAISDPSSGLPHMLPSPQAFADAVGGLGVGGGATIVVYDASGLFSAPRVWWSFRTMGVETVYVLDGGLPKWLAEGRPTETGPSARKPETFKARFDASAVKSADEVAAALDACSGQVVDARSGPRFRGEAAEPRPGLASGHMPGALNLPFSELVANGRLKDDEELRAAFEAAGVDVAQPIVTTCGSGVTAAVLAFALEGLGKSADGLYDGSWAEWGAGGRPVATGRA
ncbi:3-mercaptopyruvate sulfurtransferase [Chenggangzhangella methanolivorans]|uniref:3-mercaptopyruvate sulfurtransferase n=1 Tax=Chenggangzhangella methanolivorans TaxID=1437009 RepID=A0A9E6REX3_9HYPH|nr:3-mercaptopyruvate sulfurtransferase [Chenggangzhangella methanolivorans]QZN99960.1 3-mercaptopyruvate sulfurtransferase [Chenggangzhangella methanolivorans]